MFGVDSDIGNSALRLWVAAGSAALLVFVCALALDWSRTRTFARISVVVLGAVFGASLALAFLDAASVRDRNAERLALEMRAAELNTQVLAPGSPLACLDGVAGDSVEAACEKALFAAPATVAAATSYVSARLVLLADMAAYTRRGANIDAALLPLRHSLENDRFGFVAHALAMRDGCTSDNCKALALLHDPSRVRANLSGQTLDRYLDHYLTAWAQSPDAPVADAGSPQASVSALNQAGAPGKKVVVDIDFPTAASIPPVSIMNPEPKGPIAATAPAAVAAGAATAEASAAPASTQAAKKPRKQAANAPSQAAAPAPAAPVDPVWSPGATLASPQPAAPVQLNPAASPPQASVGTMRTQ